MEVISISKFPPPSPFLLAKTDCQRNRTQATTTTTATSFLMPLSWLAGVGNFCSNLVLPFLLIICILFSQAILFQILLYTFFPRIPWSIFLPFPGYVNFHNLRYFGIGVSMHDMTMPPQTALNYHILNLHSNTHPITKNVSQNPINQSHPTHPDHTMLHPTQPRLIHNSKFPHFTTVQPSWSNTTLINLPPLLER